MKYVLAKFTLSNILTPQYNNKKNVNHKISELKF